MDITLIIALVLFFGLVAAWVLLPGAASTGIADQDTEVLGVSAAQKA